MPTLWMPLLNRQGSWGLESFLNRDFALLFLSQEKHIILWLSSLYFVKTILEDSKGLKFLEIDEAEIVDESSQIKL